MSEQAGRYQRTFSGLIGALLVLLVVVFAFVAFRAVNRDDVDNPVEAVDYTQDLGYYRSTARFALLAPTSLPEGWRATSVRFRAQGPQSWHLGILTNEDRYVGIEQGRDSVPTMVDDHVDDAAVRGEPVLVRGVEWETWTDAGGDTALVRREKGVTTVVVGTISRDDLVDFAATLR